MFGAGVRVRSKAGAGTERECGGGGRASRVRACVWTASRRTWKWVAVPGFEIVIVAGTVPMSRRRSAVADLMACGFDHSALADWSNGGSERSAPLGSLQGKPYAWNRRNR